MAGRAGSASGFPARATPIGRSSSATASRNAIRFFFAGQRVGALDELYWNVTGNGWTMPIDSVHARVVLPDGVRPTRTAVYTGAEDRHGNDATIEQRRQRSRVQLDCAGSIRTKE